MGIDQFWKIIGEIHARSGGDMERKCELLASELSSLPPDQIREFHNHFVDCHNQAYDWGLWGAAHLIHGGCGDDTFSDFRAALISCGKEVFEEALGNPDSLADLPTAEDDLFYESFAYPIDAAVKKLAGGIDRPGSSQAEPHGEPWEDDEAVLAARFPRLYERYLMDEPDPSPQPCPWWKFW